MDQGDLTADYPGRIPTADELALRAAAERLVSEYFARLDRADVDGLLELYADDATLQEAKARRRSGRPS
jgi:ketosteroid isomerase-like protein